MSHSADGRCLSGDSPLTERDIMSETARIPLTHANTLLVRLATWWSRRTYGDVLDPGLAMLHDRKVLMTTVSNERPAGPNPRSSNRDSGHR